MSEKKEFVPLVSDEQIEWHSRHDANGELVSIETMSPWTCREIYEADRAASREIIEKLIEAAMAGKQNTELLMQQSKGCYLEDGAAIEGIDETITEARAFLNKNVKP